MVLIVIIAGIGLPLCPSYKDDAVPPNPGYEERTIPIWTGPVSLLSARWGDLRAQYSVDNF